MSDQAFYEIDFRFAFVTRPSPNLYTFSTKVRYWSSGDAQGYAHIVHNETTDVFGGNRKFALMRTVVEIGPQDRQLYLVDCDKIYTVFGPRGTI
jgi:hypothetical protein